MADIKSIEPRDDWTHDDPVSLQLAREIVFETQRTLRLMNASLSPADSQHWREWVKRIQGLCGSYLEHYDRMLAECQRITADAINANPRVPSILKEP